MPEPLTQDEAFRLAHAVRPIPGGSPLLACRACGVLLWDIAAHYRHAHPDTAIHADQ